MSSTRGIHKRFRAYSALGVLALAASLVSIQEADGASSANRSIPIPVAKTTASANTGSANDDLDFPASQYSKEMGVSVDVARNRIESQLLLEKVYPDVVDAVPEDRLGGVWISDEPEPRLNVRITKGPQPAKLTQLVKKNGDSLAVSDNAAHTANETQSIIDASISDWLKAIPSIQGVFADQSSDDVVLEVADGNAIDAAWKKGGNQGLAQRIALETSGVALDARGLDLVIEKSDKKSNQNKGGRNMTSCTSGFTVKVSGTPALLTAGHCGTPQSYYWFTGDGPFPTSYLGNRYNTHADFEWLRPTQHTVEPRFYGDTASGSGTLQKGNAENVQGAYKCHRGKTTGASCGTLTSVTYKPTWSGACPGGTCESRFVEVKGSLLKNQGGDSGGPWFMSGYGYGIHKGGSSSVAVYSKLGNLPSNVAIWVG